MAPQRKSHPTSCEQQNEDAAESGQLAKRRAKIGGGQQFHQKDNHSKGLSPEEGSDIVKVQSKSSKP